MSKVGFVGLGIMGRPMAAHLRAASDELYVHDHKPAPQTLIAQGAIECASARAVAEHVDIVACAANGGKAWDHSALVRALELLTQHQIRATPL